MSILSDIPFVGRLIDEYGEKLVVTGIEKLTGIDLSKKELTVEEKQIILDNQIKIMELDFKTLQENNRANEFQTTADNQNTANARDNNTRIQESSNSSRLAKNAPYIIDFIILGSTVVLGALLFFKSIPVENKDIANIMFGALFSLSATIINYHRGSSSGSAEKQNVLNKLQGKQNA